MAGIFDALGGASSDIFGAVGDLKEAQAYGLAAKYASQNAQISVASTNIQETQASRKIFQTLGAQSAEVASAGFASGGTNGDLARSSIAQGSLTKSLISEQGLITRNSYEEESARYKGMQSAAKAAATGGFLSGIFKVAGAFLPFV